MQLSVKIRLHFLFLIINKIKFRFVKSILRYILGSVLQSICFISFCRIVEGFELFLYNQHLIHWYVVGLEWDVEEELFAEASTYGEEVAVF